MSLAPVSVFEKSMSEPLTIDPQGAASLTQNWAGQAIETTGALLLVIAAVLGVSLLLRHLQRKAGGNTGQLQVLARARRWFQRPRPVDSGGQRPGLARTRQQWPASFTHPVGTRSRRS